MARARAVVAVSRLLRRLAAGAAAPTFVVSGAAGGDVEELLLDSRVDVVASPRHATVLLVSGHLPDPLARAAALVHDALPHPRATVWWGDGEPAPQWQRDAPKAALLEDPAAVVASVHADLMYGHRGSESPVVAQTNRSAWHGVGPYGHGGSGMTGGQPYGRPLADRGDDPRDGLSLDVLPVTAGPFFPGLPGGLTVKVALHGDVVGAAQVEADPFLGEGPAPAVGPAALFDGARAGPVGVAALEHARAAHHLRAISRTLRLHGLDALARRVLSAAIEPGASPGELRRVMAAVERTGLARVGAGVGVLPRDAAGGLGLAARASGVASDARGEDPAYDGLGFQPITQPGGDARARLHQRLAETRQSLRLAEEAGQRVREPGPPLEDPRLAAARVGATLEELLVGAEWGDAVTIVDSFDIAMGLPPAPEAATAAA